MAAQLSHFQVPPPVQSRPVHRTQGLPGRFELCQSFCRQQQTVWAHSVAPFLLHTATSLLQLCNPPSKGVCTNEKLLASFAVGDDCACVSASKGAMGSCRGV